MLNLVRTSAWKIERLEGIARLVELHPLEDAHMVRLVAQARAFAEGCQGGLLRACSLALVARLALVAPSTRTEVRQLLKAAEAMAAGIETSGDQIFFWALALPALQQVSPERPKKVVESLLRGLESLPGGSTFAANPCEKLLRTCASKQDEEQTSAAALLLQVAEICFSQEARKPFLPPWIPEMLCEQGRPDLAKDLLDRVSRHDPARVASCMAAIAHYLVDYDRGFVLAWLGAVENEVAGADLALVLAALGDWDRCSRILGGIDPIHRQEPLTTCVERAIEAKASETVRVQTVHKLMSLAEPPRLAEVEANAALALASLDPEIASEYLRRAVERSLSCLPWGAPETLRQLLGLCLAEGGCYREVNAVARGCYPLGCVRACTNIIAVTPDDEVEALEETANLVVEVCRSAEEPNPYVLRAACAAAAMLPQARSEQAEAICDVVAARLSKMETSSSFGHSEFAKCTLAVAQVQLKLDETSGKNRLDDFARWVGRVGIPQIGSEAWSETCEFLGGRATTDSDAERHLRNLGNALAKIEDAKARIPYQAAYALALRAIDTDESLSILEQLVREVEQLRFSKLKSDAVRLLITMVDELMGRSEVDISPWSAVLFALASLEPRASERLMPWMRRIIDSFIALDLGPRDARIAALDIFEAAARLPTERSEVLHGLVDPVIRRLSERLDTQLFQTVVIESIMLLSRRGHADVASRLLEHLPVGSRKAGTFHLVVASSVPPEAPDGKRTLETEMACIDSRGFFHYFLHNFGVSGVAVWLVRMFSDSPGKHSRRELLEESAPLLMLPARELWGLGAVRVLVQAVLDSDQKFIDAARLIAKKA